MTHDEMVALIRGGIPTAGGTWADFGAGTGNFTRAMRELVGERAAIYAVDRDRHALSRQPDDVRCVAADLTRKINDMPPLDGLLIANALHFVRDQRETTRLLMQYLKPGGVFLVVEYDVRLPRGYIPHPLSYTRFERIAAESGLHSAAQVGARKSPTTGTVMYAARALTS